VSHNEMYSGCVLVVCTPFEGTPCSFEGLAVGGGPELAVQCRGRTSACPHRAAQFAHNALDGRTVMWFGRTMTVSNVQSPRRCQPRGMGGDSPFNFGARTDQGI
jgi:hypothetical protein